MMRFINLLCLSVLAITAVDARRKRKTRSQCPGPGSDISKLRDYAKGMFQFGYDNYMRHAFPLDELDPIHCTGRGVDPDASNININDVLGNYSLTLVDSLDSLAILGNKTEFWKAVRLVIDTVSFDQDSTVQVFEVTIRVLGGLLSAHVIAKDPVFGMYDENYDDELLWMARDLAVRLLPAFQFIPSGIPHPRVNLRYGVPANGRIDTCTSGAGTLLLEFGVLSRLTKDPIFEAVAHRAVMAIWERRDKHTGLLGSTINLTSGDWIDATSSMGASVDSFYEYLFKAHIVFGKQEYLDMFLESFNSTLFWMRSKMWPAYLNVNMKTGAVTNYWIDSLQAYVPGLLATAGYFKLGEEQHALYYAVWKKYQAMPERFNIVSKQAEYNFYPLRPEFAESTYILHRITKDPFYIEVGRQIMCDLEKHARVVCGYATIHDVNTKEKEDRMESFFLSETLKYLYLLFDPDHVLHNKAWNHVFTTQAHVMPTSISFIDYDLSMVNLTESRSHMQCPKTSKMDLLLGRRPALANFLYNQLK
eukprot:m.117669 g.117669  ORF g.117669 m.117669 type:complete len:532 (-) comp14256_c0_seq1:67-1662(-)